jgi:ubiquinone/menaquinone biosynthesis C-methylase UbiE
MLHSDARFRPLYPSESVVRFLVAAHPKGISHPPKLLDIGSGAGRHLLTAAEMGYLPVGLDFSHTGLAHARERLLAKNVAPFLSVAGMTCLPFADETFDAVLSYGVFYYASAGEMKKSIGEVLRVLKLGAKAFVVLRTSRDYRYGKGTELEPGTFQLNIADTNELNTVQHFVTEEQIPEYFAGFSQISFEKNEFTFSDRTKLNSDWLITAQK